MRSTLRSRPAWDTILQLLLWFQQKFLVLQPTPVLPAHSPLDWPSLILFPWLEKEEPMFTVCFVKFLKIRQCFVDPEKMVSAMGAGEGGWSTFISHNHLISPFVFKAFIFILNLQHNTGPSNPSASPRRNPFPPATVVTFSFPLYPLSHIPRIHLLCIPSLGFLSSPIVFVS